MDAPKLQGGINRFIGDLDAALVGCLEGLASRLATLEYRIRCHPLHYAFLGLFVRRCLKLSELRIVVNYTDECALYDVERGQWMLDKFLAGLKDLRRAIEVRFHRASDIDGIVFFLSRRLLVLLPT